MPAGMGNSGTGCFSGGPGVNDGMILGWEFFMTFILVRSNVVQTGFLSWPGNSIAAWCTPSLSCCILLLMTSQCCCPQISTVYAVAIGEPSFPEVWFTKMLHCCGQ